MSDLAIDLRRVGMRFARRDTRSTPFPTSRSRSRPASSCHSIGPSGCGKSTIPRLVADILKPTTGDVSVCGSPRPRRRVLAIATASCSRKPAAFPWRSVQR